MRLLPPEYLDPIEVEPNWRLTKGGSESFCDLYSVPFRPLKEKRSCCALGAANRPRLRWRACSRVLW